MQQLRMLRHRWVAAVARTVIGNVLSSTCHRLARALYKPHSDPLALGFSNLDQHRMLSQLQRQPNDVLVDIKMSLLLNSNSMTRLNEICLINKLHNAEPKADKC